MTVPEAAEKPGTRKGSKNKPGAKRGGPRFTNGERERLRAKVVQLAIRDFTQSMIAEMTGVSQQLVSQWVAEEKARWATTQEDREQLVLQKRAQYEEVRREAWMQWERSKEDLQKRVDAHGSKGESEWTKEELVTEGRLAAKTFLDIILDTYRQERALLGLDVERENGNNINVNVGLNWQNILVEVAAQADPVAALEERINALSPEEIVNLPPITPEEVLIEDQMEGVETEWVDE